MSVLDKKVILLLAFAVFLVPTALAHAEIPADLAQAMAETPSSGIDLGFVLHFLETLAAVSVGAFALSKAKTNKAALPIAIGLLIIGIFKTAGLLNIDISHEMNHAVGIIGALSIGYGVYKLR